MTWVEQILNWINALASDIKTLFARKDKTKKTIVDLEKRIKNAQDAQLELTQNEKELFNTIYPVGSIIQLNAQAKPAQLFGGAWESIQGCFLLADGDVYKFGETGGEKNHQLTVEEMPSHTHSYYTLSASQGGQAMGSGSFTLRNNGNFGANSSAAGGNAAHNNMPPYLSVNMWRRTGLSDEG